MTKIKFFEEMKVKKILMSSVFISLLAAATLSACKHDPLTPLNQAPVISFKTDVLPVIVSNCTQSGCHGKQGHEFALTSYDEIMGHVQASEPHKSSLYNSITS